MVLEGFKSDVSLKDTFQQATDKADFTLIDRVSTKEGSPISVSFDLPFKSVLQATLKTSILAGESFLGNEYKLTSFSLNGKRFEVSDPRNSVNLVDKTNDTYLNKVLKPFDNVLSVNFSAPIGAGFALPNGEVSAILTVIGERDPFSLANLPNSTQLGKKAGKVLDTVKNFGIMAVIALIALAIIAVFAFGGKPSIV